MWDTLDVTEGGKFPSIEIVKKHTYAAAVPRME
jgi:hypothetical protein